MKSVLFVICIELLFKIRHIYTKIYRSQQIQDLQILRNGGQKKKGTLLAKKQESRKHQ